MRYSVKKITKIKKSFKKCKTIFLNTQATCYAAGEIFMLIFFRRYQNVEM